MACPYGIVLTDCERGERNILVHGGMAPARVLALDVNASTVLRVRHQFATEGLVATLERKRPGRVYERTLDGEQEAKLVAIACSEAPDGADLWSLCLLPEEVVRLELVPAISYEIVRRTLKNALKSWLVEQRCLAPTADSDFIWHTEDVLDAFHRPLDLTHPVTCPDETNRQLLDETRPPQPVSVVKRRTTIKSFPMQACDTKSRATTKRGCEHELFARSGNGHWA